jgi:MFS family permease
MLSLSDFTLEALIATRLLIGAFEAGFYPTAVAYLSFFYPRYDFCVRLALFYGQYAIAGAFSGSICGFQTQLWVVQKLTFSSIRNLPPPWRPPQELAVPLPN